MSQQRRGKKRTFAESEEGIAVKSIYKLTHRKNKKRRTNRTLSKQLQITMAKATSAYMNKDLETAKSLAQQIVKEKPKYPDIYDLLGKINEEQEEYATALTAYQYYITLRFPQKTIASETSRNLFHTDDDDDDSDFDDAFEDNKQPTPQLIEKIAKLALKSENYDMALKMIGMIETHYKSMIHRMNNSSNRKKISMSDAQISDKTKEMRKYLVNIYRERVTIYKKLKRFDAAKKEYELIYSACYRKHHPLLDNADSVDDKHKELLHILQQICPKSLNHSAYLYLFHYFDIFMHCDGNHHYLQWLINQITHNTWYKQCFYRLLSMFVSVGMKMFRFKAILKYLQFFTAQLPDTIPFALSIKMGICLLWIDRVEEAIEYYTALKSAPLETGFGGLYMLFADALIAKNMIGEAQGLMNCVQQIESFKQPRIWLRFADCYTLHKQYDKAIAEYIKVIDTVSATDDDTSEENENILISARLKLLQIYFIKHDEESAAELIKIIQKYKEEHVQNVNTFDAMEEEMEEDSASPNTQTVNALKPLKRVRLNPQLTSYFDTGLFGSVLVPKQLLHLELLSIELRSQYSECLQLFKSEQYESFLVKCESKIVELFAICHEMPKLVTTVYDVELNTRQMVDGLQWDEHRTIGGVVMCGGTTIRKWSHVTSINDEDVTQYKLEQIKQILSSATQLPIKVKLSEKQNLFPLLKQNRNVAHHKIYSINHLGHVLKDSYIFELVVFVCKIWYQCECDDDNECNKSNQIEMILNIVNEAASSLNPHELEFDRFWMAELHLLQANVYFNNDSFEECYHALVRVLDLEPNNVNAMRYLYQMYRHLSHHPKIERTIKRQLVKRNHNEDEMVWHQLILGHTSFSKNSYDIAANTYAQIIQKYKDSPFMHLMMALTYLQHAMKRTTKQQKYLVSIQGIAFIKRYVQLSRNTTESLYNFARAFHLLALYGCAQQLYEKIIHRIQKSDYNLCNPIRRYSAYNLAKIYLRSGQYDLAIATLKQNIVV
eukprot:867048_1